MSFWSMKPLQLLTTIPFWPTSRRLSRIILTWVLGTLIPPLHTVSQIQLLAREGPQRDNASHPLGFSVSSGTLHSRMHFHPGMHCQAPQKAAGPRPQQREQQGQLRLRCRGAGMRQRRAPPLVSMVARLSRNRSVVTHRSTLKHLCLNKSLHC